MKHRVLSLVAVLAALTGCSDSTSPVVGFNGAGSFTYTGAGGGTHSASGDFTAVTAANLYAEDWAYGVRSDAEVVTGVFSNQPRTTTTHDMMVIGINRVTAGSSSISAECEPEVDEACTGFVFYRGQSNAFGTFEHVCILTSGSVNITSISNSRMVGTFSGSGFCFDNEQNEDSFTVTNGSFDVALISEDLT
mgnify:CR=1 FL=1